MDKKIFIKALDDWELEVLGIPFGDSSHKDSDGEYFTKDTNLHLDAFGNPLIVYQHGFDKEDGKIKEMPEPEIVGQAKSYRIGQEGVWWRVALDKTSDFAKQIWESAQQGILRASSGSLPHLVRKKLDGEITNWPVGEISLLDRLAPANNYALALPVLKTRYQQAGIELPDEFKNVDEQPGTVEAGEDKTVVLVENIKQQHEVIKMEKEEVTQIIADAIKAESDRKDAEAAKLAVIEAEKQTAIEDAVKAEKAKWELDAAKGRRLPFSTPEVMKFSKIGKYDYVDPQDLAFACGVLKSQGKHVPNEALQSIAVRFAALDKPKDLEDARTQSDIKMAMAEAGISIKTDEVMQQDLTSYGDEWVAAGYSPRLWEKIRSGTEVLNNIPQEEIPQGYESMKYLLESTDPIFYKTPEVTDNDTTMLFPTATVTSSRVGTDDQDLSLGKLSARTLYSGELNEDSLIPIASKVPQQIAVAGREQLEYVIIDGDTTATQYLNINNIGGTPTSTDAYLVVDGLRHMGLVTNTDNKRAGGALTSADFIETAKLMGAAGMNAELGKCAFIIDKNVYWKALQLEDVKTQDVNSVATIEKGVLKNIWGYPIIVSNQMCFKSSVRKSQVADGWVDQTTVADNVAGSLLCVRWDQWKFGWKRRMTLETVRIPRSDATEVVAHMRFGLIYRDTEAAAITYGITV